MEGKADETDEDRNFRSGTCRNTLCIVIDVS